MKIVIAGPATAHDLDTEKKVTDPERLQALDGLAYSRDRCSNYLAPALEDLGITGGLIRLAFDARARGLHVVTEYHAPRRLTPAELKALVEETVGQWSDGIGEGEFLYRKKHRLDVDLAPRGRKPRAEQIDDGKVVKRPRVDELARAVRDRDVKAAKQLLTAGAAVNRKDKWGDTPLHLACQNGLFDLALLLLERGADARATTRGDPLAGSTPLAYLARADVSKARAAKAVPVAEALLRHGADADAADKEGITPLMWAVDGGKVPLVEFLIAAGADVNAKDRMEGNERTVLMYAWSEVAPILLRHGADPTVRNASGDTAWEYVLMHTHVRGYRQLAELLRSHAEGRAGGS